MENKIHLFVTLFAPPEAGFHHFAPQLLPLHTWYICNNFYRDHTSSVNKITIKRRTINYLQTWHPDI